MALAFHHDTTTHAPAGVLWASRRAHLVVVASPETATPRRPVSRAVYRRRRLVVSAVAGVMALALALGVASAVDQPVGQPLERPLAGSGSISSWIATDDGVLRYVVAEGDSLWSIAEQLEGLAPHRLLVDHFVTVNGSARIVPGQVLEILP